jgi:hypothetical protein
VYVLPLSSVNLFASTKLTKFSFLQNDSGARQFLEEIDNHPAIGGLVDCTSNYVRPRFLRNSFVAFLRVSLIFAPFLQEQEADDFQRTTQQELTPELCVSPSRVCSTLY